MMPKGYQGFVLNRTFINIIIKEDKELLGIFKDEIKKGYHMLKTYLFKLSYLKKKNC